MRRLLAVLCARHDSSIVCLLLTQFVRRLPEARQGLFGVQVPLLLLCRCLVRSFVASCCRGILGSGSASARRTSASHATETTVRLFTIVRSSTQSLCFVLQLLFVQWLQRTWCNARAKPRCDCPLSSRCRLTPILHSRVLECRQKWKANAHSTSRIRLRARSLRWAAAFAEMRARSESALRLSLFISRFDC